jgi:predicted metal-dependent enzyme (double-stranded beta helix superfamily)
MYIKQLITLVSTKLSQGTPIRNLSPFLRDYYYQYNKDEIEEYKSILRKLNNIKKYNKLLLYENNNFEMKLINWGIGSKTKIHHHDNQQCTFILLEGELKERLYTLNTYQNGSKINKQNQLSYVSKNIVLPSDVSYIDDKIGYHSIENIYKTQEIVKRDCIMKHDVCEYSSLSLHVYSNYNKHKYVSNNMYFDEDNTNLLREDYI